MLKMVLLMTKMIKSRSLEIVLLISQMKYLIFNKNWLELSNQSEDNITFVMMLLMLLEKLNKISMLWKPNLTHNLTSLGMLIQI